MIEWWYGAHFASVPFEQVRNARRVAEGFDKIYGTLKVTMRSTSAVREAAAVGPALEGTFAEQVAQAIRAHVGPRKPGLEALDLTMPTLAVTGHSLGASLCALYVVENATKKILTNPTVCTFASPRVGNAAFTQAGAVDRAMGERLPGERAVARERLLAASTAPITAGSQTADSKRMLQVAVINESTAIDDATVQSFLPAFAQQWNEDRISIWPVLPSQLNFIPKGTAPASGTWWVVFLDDSDQADTLAYHDLTNDGFPISKVFVKTPQAEKASISVGATHEMCEMALDPWLNSAIRINREPSGRARSVIRWNLTTTAIRSTVCS